MAKTKYTVKVQYPLYLDIEVEAENIPDARAEAMKIAEATPLGEWDAYAMPEVFETEWTDEDGINTVI